MILRFWPYIAALLAFGGLWLWHSNAVSASYAAGVEKQASVDRDRLNVAERAATAAQTALRARTSAASAVISKDNANALETRNADLSRRYDDLRKLWAAHRANPGGAGEGGATGPARTAAGVDGAACAAEGWVSLDVAGAAALAADQAIARDDAWREWWTAQVEAWPE